MDGIQKGIMLRLYAYTLRLTHILALAAAMMAAPLSASARGAHAESALKSSVARTKAQVPEAKDLNFLDLGLVNSAISHGNKLAHGMKVPGNAYKAQAGTEAQKAFEFYKSAAFQQRIVQETARLKRQVFKGINAYYKDLPGVNKKRAGQKGACLAANERIYLFISSSVPERTLRTYMEQIAALKDPNVVVLMRGFIDGMKKMGPTLQFIQGLLEKVPSQGLSGGLYGVNVEVDPLLFRRYGIDRVPAVVYVPDIEVERPGSEGFLADAKVSQWYVFYGDSALSYSLKRINEEAKSASLAGVIRGLKHGFYK